MFVILGAVIAAFGLGVLTNSQYTPGWVLVAVGGAFVCAGIIALAWKVRPGRISV